MLKRILAGGVILLGVGLVGFGIYKWWQSRQPSAGLKVDTSPAALVFVDNVQVGQTPVEKLFKPGEVTVKLIPDSTNSALTTYQTKVHLYPQTFTVIRREFGPSEADSAGETISVEPQSGKVASLVVVTADPTSASVLLDGQPQGFTPLLVSNLTPGDHRIALSAPGYADRIIYAKAVAGYKLSVNAKLAGKLALPSAAPLPSPEASSTPSAQLKPSPSPRPSPRPSPVAVARPYAQIKDTPTGFLRVRSKPSTGGAELGKVYPDEKYPLLDQAEGWYLIKVDIQATSSGWISAQYADKFE